MVKSLKCFLDPKKKKKKKTTSLRDTWYLKRTRLSFKEGTKNFYCLREEENPTFLATKRLLHALIKSVGKVLTGKVFCRLVL